MLKGNKKAIRKTNEWPFLLVALLNCKHEFRNAVPCAFYSNNRVTVTQAFLQSFQYKKQARTLLPFAIYN
jgi:hypothetical protein